LVRAPHLAQQEMHMIRTRKGIVALIVAFGIIGAALNYFGLPKSSTASTRQHATTISPEQLTRIADPMPVQLIENYQ
jgi:multisubunit Na+/H+ antiporter MnhC subunit